MSTMTSGTGAILRWATTGVAHAANTTGHPSARLTSAAYLSWTGYPWIMRRVDVATAAACARIPVRTLQRWIAEERLTVTGTRRRRWVDFGEVCQLVHLMGRAT